MGIASVAWACHRVIPRLPHRWAVTLLVALCAFVCGESNARADGGPTIAAATAVIPGQQQFGNTATSPAEYTAYCCDYHRRSWWALGVAAGDAVTIDWEAPGASSTHLAVFGVGVTDFTFLNADPSYEQDLTGNAKNELTFTAAATGTMPMEFSGRTSSSNGDVAPYIGPYDFTVNVKHGVRLGLPAVTALPARGALGIGVHSPDGGAIGDPAVGVALQVHAAGQPWTTIGSATPAGGTATIGYTMPAGAAGHRVRLRAIAGGAGYTSASTASRLVAVTPALRIGPPRVSRLSTRGTVRIGVRAFAGAAITDPALKVDVQLYYRGSWRVVGTGRVSRSVAVVRLRIPRGLRGKHLRIRVRARGDYPVQVSASRHILVR